MNKQTTSIYHRFRKLGYKASESLRNAKIVQQFEQLEDEYVRITAESEFDNYFDVYGEPDTEKERKTIIEAIDSKGCWYVKTEFFNGEDWEYADSIGMNIYWNPCSPYENDYVVDLMQSAIDKALESITAQVASF